MLPLTSCSRLFGSISIPVIHNASRISHKVFFLVILPTLSRCLYCCRFLLRLGWGFWYGLGVACLVTAAAYFGIIWCLEKLSIPYLGRFGG